MRRFIDGTVESVCCFRNFHFILIFVERIDFAQITPLEPEELLSDLALLLSKLISDRLSFNPHKFNCLLHCDCFDILHLNLVSLL